MENEKRERIKCLKGEEEEEMEKLYALIRSFGDARDERRNELKEMEMINHNNNKQKQKQMMILKKRKAADQQPHTLTLLLPSFRMEDFNTQPPPSGAEAQAQPHQLITTKRIRTPPTTLNSQIPSSLQH